MNDDNENVVSEFKCGCQILWDTCRCEFDLGKEFKCECGAFPGGDVFMRKCKEAKTLTGEKLSFHMEELLWEAMPDEAE